VFGYLPPDFYSGCDTGKPVASVRDYCSGVYTQFVRRKKHDGNDGTPKDIV
jgi:hypothetical protein